MDGVFGNTWSRGAPGSRAGGYGAERNLKAVAVMKPDAFCV
jgi:hypothetical protein